MRRDFLNDFVYFTFTTFIIILPAIYNGYPLVHQDSGHYLIKSISLISNGTTPLGYSLFIRAFSWQTLVWTVVLAQSLILNLYIFSIIKSFLAEKVKDIRIIHWGIVLLLGIFSGMGWFTSMLMPDMFTAYGILAFYFLIRKDSSLFVRIINAVVIFWACISHFSNTYIILFLLLVFIVVFYRSSIIRPQIKLFPLLSVLLILIASNLFIRAYNYYDNYGFISSRYSHAVVLAKFVEYGILEDYLDKNCDDNSFKLCEYKGNFPNTTGGFIWGSKSPFYKAKSWDSLTKEYKYITHDIVRQPGYLFTYFSKSIYSSMKQFIRIKLDIIPRQKGTNPYRAIDKEFPFDLHTYSTSLQYWDKLNLTIINRIYYLLYIISGLYVVYLILRRRIDISERLIPLILLTGLFANAIVCGTIATVVDRFQSRIGWILIFLAILLFVNNNYHSIRKYYARYKS